MLVLSRSTGQRIVIPLGIGRLIIIELCESKAGQARLGFDAPADVQIFREEVFDSVRATGAKKPRLALD